MDLLLFCSYTTTRLYSMAVDDKLFGSNIRTDTLVTIGRLQRTYLSEIARVLDRRLIEIQRAVATLELAGVIVTASLGNTRIVELNHTYPAKNELYALLLRMSEMPMYADRWPKIRRRRRAMGKPR